VLPRLRHLAGLLLAVAYATVAVLPCQPVLEDRDDAPPFAASAERLEAWHAAHEDEGSTSIAAECPCGCEKKSPVRAGGGSGFALSPAPAAPAIGAAHLALAPAAPAPPSAPQLGVDPVPV
jgi:hypothetical protein